MLSSQIFDEWCRRNRISAIARKYIERVRTSNPSRPVQGGGGNFTGRQASTKMGHTISIESATVEYVAALTYLYRDDVLEYWEQVEPITLTYTNLNGRQVTHLHTPDFLILTITGVAWHEWKKEKGLVQLAEKCPARYVLENGAWRCPPGEAVGEQYGIRYELHSSTELDPYVAQNQLWLRPYFDSPGIVTKNIEASVISALTDAPGMVLTDLYARVPDLRPDDVHNLIVTKQIYFDFMSGRLSEPTEVQLYLDVRIAQAYATSTSTSARISTAPTITLQTGNQLNWQGRIWNVLNVADTAVALMNDQGQLISLPQQQLQGLVSAGQITGASGITSSVPPHVQRMILGTAQEQWAIAISRWKIVRAAELLTDTTVHDAEQISQAQQLIASVKVRNLRYLKMLYRRGQQSFGQYAIVELIPKTRLRGNRTLRISTAAMKLIEESYEPHRKPAGPELHASYNDYLLTSKQQSTPHVSYKTYRRHLRLRHTQYELQAQREGPKAAYASKGRVSPEDSPLPRHGSHPWERAHIDHYELPEAVFDPVTGFPFGKPWWSVMYAPYCRRVLAQFLSLHAPSKIQVLMLFRICVKRFGRLPQLLILDRGPEFSSTDIEAFLATYRIDKWDRPASEPRFGSPLERFFGTTETEFAEQLKSTTKLLANVRQLPKWLNPLTDPKLTLGDSYMALSKYGYEYWDHRPHPELGMTPLQAYELGMAKAGDRKQTLVPYDDLFRILTMPHIGKVHIYPGQGFRYQYHDYYAPAFEDPLVEHQDLEAREDFLDAGHAYVKIGDLWVEAKCPPHSNLHGHSTRERAILAQEIAARRRGHSSRLKESRLSLAQLLRDTRCREDVLKEMRRAAEDRMLALSVTEDPAAIPPNAYAERLLNHLPVDELMRWLEECRRGHQTGIPQAPSAPLMISTPTALPARRALPPPVSFNDPNRYEVP